MYRFFVPPDLLEGQQARLSGAVAHQIARVLRMSAGDMVVLLDGSGREYVTRLERFTSASIEGQVVEVRQGQGEPSVKLTLYQSLLKGDKLDWVLQKGTELGIWAFVPLISQRSIPRAGQKAGEGQERRWQRIVAEAAEQSGRCLMPRVSSPLSFQDACSSIGPQGLSLIPWEVEQETSLAQAMNRSRPQELNLFIGPEGGWGREEVTYATGCGIMPVSLGRRVLRSETAAIATVAAVMYHLGELGTVAGP